jgi:hypothetical protein
MLLDGTAKISDCGTATILSHIMPSSGFIYAQQALNSDGFASFSRLQVPITHLRACLGGIFLKAVLRRRLNSRGSRQAT